MSNLYALARESGQIRNLTTSDALVIAGIQRTSGDSGSIAIGTDANTTGVDIGSTGVLTTVKGDFQVDGTTTLVDTSTLEGDVDLGNGDGDVITLGGAYVSAVDVVNIGTAHASGDTDVNLRVDMGIDLDKGIYFDRTADSEAVLILPDTDDAAAGLGTGAIRVNGSGSLQWYNGSVWQTAGTSAGNSLDQAYQQGNSITATVAEGNLQFELTENTAVKHRITTTNASESDYWDFTTPGVDQLSVNAVLQTLASNTAGGTTFDAAGASWFKVAGAALNLETSTSGNIVINSAGAVTVDGVGISIDGTSTSNFTMTTGGSARPLTIESNGGGAVANTLVLNSDGTGADAIDINATVGGVDIDAATTVGITAAGGGFTLQGAGVSSITTSSSNLIINNTGTGGGTVEINCNEAGAINIGGSVSGSYDTTPVNIGTSANDGRTITIGYYPGSGTSGSTLDVNSKTITIDSGPGGISVDSGANANFSASEASPDTDLTLDFIADNTGTPSAGTNDTLLTIEAKSTNGDSDVVIKAGKSDGSAANGNVTVQNGAGTTVATFGTDIGGVGVGFQLNTGTDINEFSTDGTLSGNSDDAVPTEQAVKTYVDAQIGGSNSLEEVYNGGAPGTPDNLVTMSTASGTVSWTVPDTANIVAMSFIQNDTTNNPNAVVISNAGTGAALSLQGAGSRTIVSASGNMGLTTTTSGNINFTAVDSIGLTFDSLGAGSKAFSIKEGANTLATFGSGDITFTGNTTSNLYIGDIAAGYQGVYANVAINHATDYASIGGQADNAGAGPSAATLYASNSGSGLADVIIRATAVTADSAAITIRSENNVKIRYNEDGSANSVFEIQHNATKIIEGSATGRVNITPISGQDANISTAGTGSGIILSSAGTDAAAIDIDSAGGIDADAADLISFVSSLANVAVQLSATDAAGGIDFNAGTRGFDFDASTGTFDVLTQAISLDSTISSNFTITGNSASTETLTFKTTNAGAGTGAISMTSDGNISVDNEAGTTGKIQIGAASEDGAISLGTGANTGRNVEVGNITGTSTTAIKSGTGGLTLQSTDLLYVDSALSSRFEITANSASDQTLTLKATNAGAATGKVLVEADGTITFDALGMTTPLPLNQNSAKDLVGFTATSIVGCLNELKGEVGGIGVWLGTVDEVAGVAANDVVCLANPNAAGILSLADANGASLKFVVGVVVTGAAQTANAEVASSGKVTVSTTDAGAWNCGDAIYLSETAGDGTSTAPTTSGSVVQRIGWATGSGREVVLALGEPTLI